MTADIPIPRPPIPRAVVIGASAGAIQALSEVLPALPPTFPLPILIVVHIPADGGNMLAPLFAGKCRIAVREAEDKEPVLGGTAYFAPPDYHLLVEAGGTLSLSSDEAVLHSRPAIDVLFESAADAYGGALVGIVLTGANQDGAAGLRAIAQAGGIVLVEDPSIAYADAMPLAALSECPEARVLSLAGIADFLLEVGKGEGA
ncbi:two-component system chemotaxis response regulator CheB [Novosphingobium sp. PhB165]|uniref:chemotaxis protein CheB n=1 Tax=Novosphingobium sp. PhB165 TaxID=2485105 RepID=UPI00104B9D81|nr:chemotaxis protein CheB [Novosphingobium sp. PhB165]TCM16156.1 two-component system chemotaxis response regulator CheB [Novosphingobium sp. PhB165]